MRRRCFGELVSCQRHEHLRLWFLFSKTEGSSLHPEMKVTGNRSMYYRRKFPEKRVTKSWSSVSPNDVLIRYGTS